MNSNMAGSSEPFFAGPSGRFTNSFLRSSGQSMPQTNVVRGRETSSGLSGLQKTHTLGLSGLSQTTPSTGFTEQFDPALRRPIPSAVSSQPLGDSVVSTSRPGREESSMHGPISRGGYDSWVAAQGLDSDHRRSTNAIAHRGSLHTYSEFTNSNVNREMADLKAMVESQGREINLMRKEFGSRIEDLEKLTEQQRYYMSLEKRNQVLEQSNQELQERLATLERAQYGRLQSSDSELFPELRRAAQISQDSGNNNPRAFDSGNDTNPGVVAPTSHPHTRRHLLQHPQPTQAIMSQANDTLQSAHTSRGFGRVDDESCDSPVTAINTQHTHESARIGNSLDNRYNIDQTRRNTNAAVAVERPRISMTTETEPSRRRSSNPPDMGPVKSHDSSHEQTGFTTTLGPLRSGSSEAMRNQSQATQDTAAADGSKKRASEAKTASSNKRVRKDNVDFPDGTYNIKISEVWKDGDFPSPGNILVPVLRKQFSQWYDRDLNPYKEEGKLSKLTCLERKRKKKGMNNTAINTACRDCGNEGNLCIKIVKAGILSVLPLQEVSRKGTKTSLGYWMKTEGAEAVEEVGEAEDYESETDPEA